MEVNYGIDAGESLTRNNDIFIELPSSSKVLMVSVPGDQSVVSTATGDFTDFAIGRGRLLKQFSGQHFEPLENDFDFDTLETTDLLAVALQDVTVKDEGTKVPAIVEGGFIKQRLLPNPPTGVYNFGNIIIKDEINY